MTFSFARSCLDVIANDSSPDCGISREVESDERRFRSRIVGGGDVSEGEIPWQVGFDFFQVLACGDITLNPTQAALLEFGDLGKLLCGAVLVSSRYVSKLEETFLRT